SFHCSRAITKGLKDRQGNRRHPRQGPSRTTEVPRGRGTDRRMEPHATLLATPDPPEPRADALRCKVRLRFRKGGDLRLVSHHDLMRCFERMLRRAGLPYRSTAGFNPKPRLVFASALPLGVVGCEEVVELE